MKKRLFWCGLATTAIVLTSGVAFSGGTTTSLARVLDYEDETHQLWVMSPGGAASYVHSERTLHLLATLPRPELPPDPCFQIARIWNAVVRFEAQTGQTPTRAFGVLLEAMGIFSCQARVTIPIDSGSPVPLVSVAPAL
jgi:hypothetical protein